MSRLLQGLRTHRSAKNAQVAAKGNTCLGSARAEATRTRRHVCRAHSVPRGLLCRASVSGTARLVKHEQACVKDHTRYERQSKPQILHLMLAFA